jgi:hypothetical protein
VNGREIVAPERGRRVEMREGRRKDIVVVVSETTGWKRDLRMRRYQVVGELPGGVRYRRVAGYARYDDMDTRLSEVRGEGWIMK